MPRITETSLVIDSLHCWAEGTLSREQLLGILRILCRSPEGVRSIEQIVDVMQQALDRGDR